MTDSISVVVPGWRATDANDEPISGAKLKFYDAGASTPKTVYSNHGLTVSLGSTVTCDSAGYPTSDGSTRVIIYTGTADYKILCTTSADVTVWSHDNVRGASVIPTATTSGLPTTPVISKVQAYTVVTGDRGKLINANPTGGSFSVTLPSAVTAGDDFKVGVKHLGTANAVAIVTVSSQTIAHSGQSSTAKSLASFGETMWFVSDGANWHVDSYVPSLLTNTTGVVRITDRLTAPPASPTPGARYIINGTPTGIWATLGFDLNDIVEADGNGSWIEINPTEGMFAYVVDENIFTAFVDAAWSDQTGMAAPSSSSLKVAVFEHTATNGTVGGTATTGAWTTRTAITTEVVNTITGASLSAGVVTLPVGSYSVRGWQTLYNVSQGQSRLAVLSGTATPTTIVGGAGTLQSFGDSDGDTGSINIPPPDVFGILTVTAEATIALQYWVAASSGGTSALGVASAEPGGSAEIYARLEIVSLAALQGPAGPSGGEWTESTLTADHTVTTAENQYHRDLNSGVGTVTFPAASGFPAMFRNKITNNTSRGWTIAPSGGTSFTLYPTQTCTVTKSGSAWAIENDFRWQTRTSVTFYVNHATGSNSNDGLTSGSAFATIQKAIDVIEARLDCLVNGPTIQVADGTFTENDVVHTKRLMGNHVISIQGNTATPTNCVWQCASGQTCFTARDWSGVILSGFKFAQASGTGAILVTASQHGIVDIGNVDWGSCTGGTHLASYNGGSVGYSVGAAASISGDAAIHWQVTSESCLICTGATYTISSARTFSAFLSLNGGSVTLSAVTFTGAGVAGTTGAQYSSQPYSTLLISGTTLPGTTPAETIYPQAGATSQCGTATNPWTVMSIGNGGYLDFYNGDVRFTHSSGAVRLTSGAWGYGAGTGGTVTQATSKATGVTLSKQSGQITMHNAALAADTIVSFVLTNTTIAAGDVLILNHVSGGTIGSYSLNARCGAGSATIDVRNNTAGSLGEAIVIAYVLIKGATA